ncbi:MAG: sigma-70 family RNA polymerase sigma factor [Planctomycetes bacterium]|nr:sigma-70 family RNA polymerase sigma factor [Planctomycetota bacterium]
MRELYDRLVRTHHAAVWSSAWRIVRNDADAHDVTQEVFLQVLRRGDEIARSDAPERVLRWLAAKTALAHLRAGRNRQRREEHVAMGRPEHDDPKGADHGGVRGAEQRELADAVRRCVAELPDELRLATTLRFAEGFTFAQLGECMGVAEPTAFERVKKAVAQLRARLTQLGHAGIAVEVEQWLARSEPIAVPSGLAASLLALSASGAGIAAGSAVAATTAVGSATAAGAAGSAFAGKGLALAAAVLVFGSGAWLWKTTHTPADPTAASATPPLASAAADDARSEPGRDALDGSRVADPLPAASRTALAPTDDRERPSAATRGDFLRSSLGTPPLGHGSDLTLPVATATLTGTIVDEARRTIAGARIVARSSELVGKGDVWIAEAESGPDGAFALRVAIADPLHEQGYRLTITHPDLLPHATDRIAVTADATRALGSIATRRVQAERAGDYTLAVRVRDAEGRPVEGAWVRVYRQLLADGEAAPEEARAAIAKFETQAAWEGGARTDGSGLAKIDGRRLGAKWLVVEARPVGQPSLRTRCEVGFTGWQEHDVVLPLAHSIEGRLVLPPGVDATVLARPGAATIEAISASDSDPYVGTLDGDGRFTIGGLPAGPYRVACRVAAAARLSPAAQFDVPAGSRDVALELKAVDDLAAHGHHLAEVHGRAVDARSGAPVACEWECLPVPTTDLEVLRRDHFATLLAPRAPVQTLQQSELFADPSAREGETLEEALERVARSVAVNGSTASGADGTALAAPTEQHTTGLEAGCYVVRVRAEGYATALSEPFELGPRTLKRDVVVRLAAPARVIGRVVDDAGAPRSIAVVVALAPAADAATREAELAALATQLRGDGRGYLWAVQWVRAGPDGRFTLDGLTPGFDYELAVLPIGGPALRRAPLRLAPGATEELGDWSADA